MNAHKSDVWTTLSRANKPIVLYGMGNGADKILSVFSEYGISCSGVFASDDFVRGQSFHGMTVERYADVCRRLGDFIVVVAFASRLPDVIGNVLRIAAERETYIPDVPVVGDSALFDLGFLQRHEAELSEARELFCDEESRALFDDMIEYKLSATCEPLFRRTISQTEHFTFPLTPDRYTSYVDAGAYNGDTLMQLAAVAPRLEYCLAIEPDRKNFRKLAQLSHGLKRFDAVNRGAWDKRETLSFMSDAGRGSVISERVKDNARRAVAEMTTVDIALGGRRADYIKYDVEGAEYRALIGSAETIRAFAPDMCVSAYHRSEDLYELPLLLKRLCGDHSLYLRRAYCMPAWEMNIYAVKKH